MNTSISPGKKEEQRQTARQLDLFGLEQALGENSC